MPMNESGDVDSVSAAGSERDMDSSDSLENIVLSVSKRGRMTVSRYAVRTILLTSSA